MISVEKSLCLESTSCGASPPSGARLGSIRGGGGEVLTRGFEVEAPPGWFGAVLDFAVTSVRLT